MFTDELVQSDILLRSLFVSYIASLLGKIDCLRLVEVSASLMKSCL